MQRMSKIRRMVSALALMMGVSANSAHSAKVSTECLEVAEAAFKHADGRYYLKSVYVASKAISDQELKEFYVLALGSGGFREITSCGNLTRSSDIVKKGPSYKPPACDPGWGDGPRRFILGASDPIKDRGQFNQFADQACRVETDNVKMSEFWLLVVNPKPPVVYGAPPSESRH